MFRAVGLCAVQEVIYSAQEVCALRSRSVCRAAGLFAAQEIICSAQQVCVPRRR